ncbi:MAG TPA: VWA domain-containing protein [bacterium]|nr:VWA domain-containing protein [bacterium]
MINFAHPERLYLLLLAPALAIFFLAAMRMGRRALGRFGNPELLMRAGMAVSMRGRAAKALLVLVAVCFIVLALAAPQWGATREKIERKGVDVVVVLDTSASMLAQDVAPARLAKAKNAIQKLVELMKGDRIGIVVFSGAAFTMCPLTLDYDAARMFLDIIDEKSVPEPGTDIPDALEEAAKNFDRSTNKHKVIILITDGENLEQGREGKDPVKVAGDLHQDGAVIYTVGVGRTEGAPIPLETPNGTVDKTDRQGKVVITKLDENTLRKIALAGDGKYRRLDNRASGTELADIYAGIAGMEKKTFEEQYQVHYEDRFQWFVAIAIACLMLEAVIPDGRRRKNK